MVGAPVMAASSAYVVLKTVAGGGPHDVVALEPRVEPGRHRPGVTDGGDATDDLAGVLADELGLGPPETPRADPRRDLVGVDPV
jgi:hypothetical protein